jgi:alkylated DNA nucleotide flippase Atl1
VAAEAGFPGAARAVGRILATADHDLPWWRVVTASGRLVPGHEDDHARRLRAEGVATADGHVVVPTEGGVGVTADGDMAAPADGPLTVPIDGAD